MGVGSSTGRRGERMCGGKVRKEGVGVGEKTVFSPSTTLRFAQDKF